MARNTVLLVTRNGLGFVKETDRAFGLEMFDRFLHTLETEAEKPAAICFYTEGVRLVCEGSPAILGLELLQGLGVQLVACKTCLEKYDLVGRVAVGQVGTMKDIVRLLQAAEKVVTL
jgi:intracellular sulfur oxidation DsrE/DsrF family protein